MLLLRNYYLLVDRFMRPNASSVSQWANRSNIRFSFILVLTLLLCSTLFDELKLPRERRHGSAEDSCAVRGRILVVTVCAVNLSV